MISGRLRRPGTIGKSRRLNSLTSGDVVLIQFAGHGTFVKDLDGDEADKFDEALCPVDFHAGSLILDDDLAPI